MDRAAGSEKASPLLKRKLAQYAPTLFDWRGERNATAKVGLLFRCGVTLARSKRFARIRCAEVEE